MAVVLWAASAGLFVVSALLEHQSAPLWMRVVAAATGWAGALGLLLATGYSARKPLRRWLERQLVELTGPAIIRSMPPRAVLGSILPRIYGDRTSTEVVTGILGGAGRDPWGGDTAVSRETTIHFQIESVSDTECISYLTSTHEYSGIRNSHFLMIFATSDREIASLVASERVYPLYELWVVGEEDLEEFVPSVHENLRVGIRYGDRDGNSHVVAPRPLHGDEVAFRHYDQYVRLPEHIDRKNLRIVRLDLHDLADDDHVVESVDALTVRMSNVAAFDLGYLVWTPPHPCYVRTISFDLSGLARTGQTLVHLVALATITRAGLQQPIAWLPVPDRIEVPVDSWMLPGHNVTLLYRPSNAAESPHAPELG
jgi:hypothetical protein